MRPSVYIETTIPSYLTAWSSRDLIIAGHQQITKEWWTTRQSHFSMYVSELVIQECKGGDPLAIKDRMEAIKGISILKVTKEAEVIAGSLLIKKIIPKKAFADAIHIAVAAENECDYLMTWNCRHIANAEIYFHVRELLSSEGFQCPIICTPTELMGE